MKLYQHDLSPNCLRVRAVGHELGVEFELVPVDLRQTSSNAELLALNPNGKVPVLVDGDFVLWESRAINGYLASLHPEKGLYSSEPQRRALIDQWSLWQAIHLGPAMQKVAFERVFKARFKLGEPDEKVIAAQLANSRTFLAVFEKGLGSQDWIAGALSIADFALGSTFMLREPAGISLEDFPAVAGWIARLEARESWRRAVAPLLAA